MSWSPSILDEFHQPSHNISMHKFSKIQFPLLSNPNICVTNNLVVALTPRQFQQYCRATRAAASPPPINIRIIPRDNFIIEYKNGALVCVKMSYMGVIQGYIFNFINDKVTSREYWINNIMVEFIIFV
jgi:hypothetical protein